MNFRRYTVGLVLLTLTILGGVGLFNLIVDPYGYFRLWEVAGFNLEKPALKGYERLVKSALVAKRQPAAVIVGTSLADIGFSPLNPDFTNNGQFTSYNFGIAGAQWPEVYCNARFALEQASLRRLLVGVSGSEIADCSSSDLGRINLGKLVFSAQAFQSSKDTLRKQQGGPYATAEGLWYGLRYDPKVKNDEDVARTYRSFFRGWACASPHAAGGAVSPTQVDRVSYAPSQGEGLRNLIRMARERGVILDLVFYPQHVLASEMTRLCADPAERWRELWRVARLIEDESATDYVRLWDFYGYDVWNGEPIWAGKPVRNRLWQDGSHFNTEVGDAAFATIYGMDDGRGSNRKRDYGSPVTTAGFNQLLMMRERQRLDFLDQNSWVYEELGRIAGPAGQNALANCLGARCRYRQ